jgi:tetratricopeptide (TPR) repeat protein
MTRRGNHTARTNTDAGSNRAAADFPRAAPRIVGNLLTASLYLLVALVVYANTFSAPLVFDDFGSIVENGTIRDLTNLGEVFLPKPRGGTTIDGRPLLNFSFAINYAISQLQPWSYHLFNVLLHVVNACLLQGLLRRIFVQPACPQMVRENASWLAMGAALLWLVHPLQTAAVTYVVQRAESLMALFYLATLYGFMRMATSPQSLTWAVVTVAVCWLGQAAKEVMATAPLAVLALDVAFVSGSLAAAIRQRWKFYIWLFAAWLWTAALLLHTGSRSGTVGMNGARSPLSYFVAQCGHLLNYLRLSIWPSRQIFDYGTEIVPWNNWQWLQVLAIVALIVVILWLCWRSPRLGVIGLIPMLILAPTSSFIPVITQVAVEHRMYLPLASVATICVLILLYILIRLFPDQVWRQRILFAVIVTALAVGLGSATYLRNRVYETKQSLWADTVHKLPTNIRACEDLATELIRQHKSEEALAVFEPALAIDWDRPAALMGRSHTLLNLGRIDAAIADLEEGSRLDPRNDALLNDLAVAYGKQEKWELMLRAADAAQTLSPNNGSIGANRAVALSKLGRAAEAQAQFKKAIEDQPYVADSQYLFGSYWYSHGNRTAAIPYFKQAIYYKADYSDAEYWLAAIYLKDGNLLDAILTTDALLKHDPAPRGWEMLASIYEAGGDSTAARRTLANGLKQNPDSAGLHLRLGRLLASLGESTAALPEFQRAAQLAPQSGEVLANLAGALLAIGRKSEAQEQAKRALALDPKQPLAREVQSHLNPAAR